MTPVSLSPKTYVEGGGLLDDVDGVVKAAEFCMYDYNGKSAPAPSLHLTIETQGNDGPESHEQYWSAGKATDFAPTKDGKGLDCIGTATAINAGSNLAMFTSSLVNAGFPEEKLGEDIGVLVGLEAHFTRVAVQRRQRPGDDPNKKNTVLQVSAITKLPWEKNAAGGKSKPSGAQNAAAKDIAGAAGTDLQPVILEILSTAADNTLTKSQLPALVMPKIAAHPDKAAMIKLLFNDDYLGSAANPWKYNGGKLSLS